MVESAGQKALSHGRLAQGKSTSLTRKGSVVQILYRPLSYQRKRRWRATDGCGDHAAPHLHHNSARKGMQVEAMNDEVSCVECGTTLPADTVHDPWTRAHRAQIAALRRAAS